MKTRPQLTRELATEILKEMGVLDPVAILAMRGYYEASDERGTYNDALFLVSPSRFISFNANTDPNGYRPGHGIEEPFKGLATLKEGVWAFRVGVHRGSYEALVQDEPVTVLRDADEYVPLEKRLLLNGLVFYEDTGHFGIHIHRGGSVNTGSLGCITIAFPQWPEFITAVKEEMSTNGMSRIPMLLIEERAPEWNP